MPRPQRCRKIRSYPEQWSFLPEDGETGQTPVILTLDEYETVRLLDFCGPDGGCPYHGDGQL